MRDSGIRKLVVLFWRNYERFKLKKRFVYIDKDVKFNPSSTFNKHIRIHQGTNVCDSVIGSFSYVSYKCFLPNCIIGKYCSIADNVQVITSTHPSREFVSTSPVFHSIQGQCGLSFVKEKCFEEILQIQGRSLIIENDVWIGSRVTLMGGIKIGNGAIIGAGAVVTKDVPAYAVVGGVPSKVIRYRFSDDKIEKLLALQWWEKPVNWIKMHVQDFSNIDVFLDNIGKE